MRVSASPRHGKHVTRPITCSTPAHPDCRAPRPIPSGCCSLIALQRLRDCIRSSTPSSVAPSPRPSPPTRCRTPPVTHLERSAAWSRAGASRTVTATRLHCPTPRDRADVAPRAVSTEVVAALARGLAADALRHRAADRGRRYPELKRMSVAEVKELVSRALDLLPSQDRDAAEQHDYDRRGVWWTTAWRHDHDQSGPAGCRWTAVTAALTALAESLRVEGDGLTSGQRRADAPHDHRQLCRRARRPTGQCGRTARGCHHYDRRRRGRPSRRRSVARDRHRPDRSGPQWRRPGTAGRDPHPRRQCHAGRRCRPIRSLRRDLDRCAGRRSGPRSLPISQAMGRTRSQPLALGRSTRLASAGQRTALALRDGGCILCDRPAGECQTHHVTPWSEGGTTDVDEMCLLCWSHHRQVDLGRWKILRNSDPSQERPIGPWPRFPVSSGGKHGTQQPEPCTWGCAQIH